MRSYEKQSDWSMTKFERRQCKGKHKYTSEKAERIAAKMTKKKGVLFNAYLCGCCGRHHVGHERTPFRMFMLKKHETETYGRNKMNIKCKKCNSERMYLRKISDCTDCDFNGAWDEPGIFIYDQEEINDRNLESNQIERDQVQENGECKHGIANGDGCWIVTCAKCGEFVEHLPLYEV